MSALTFDTYALIKRLEESGFAEKQAVAVSEAIRITQEASLQDLATKRDIKELEATTRHALDELKFDMLKWMISIAFAMIFAQTGLMFILLRFVLKEVN